MMRGRRRLTCVHEAGHCLARWFFGFHIDDAAVLSAEQVMAGETLPDRRDRQIRCEGIVNGHDIHFTLGPDIGMGGIDKAAYLRNGQRRAEIALVELMAGMAAEARYRRRPLFEVYWGGGEADQEQARRIAEQWFGLNDANAAIDLACRRAAALVRSLKGQAAIGVIAEDFRQHGRLEGDQIHKICEAAFGFAPAHDAWEEAWPPTLAQLRAGASAGVNDARS